MQDINYFTNKVCFIPKREIVTYDYIAESKDLPYERIEALKEIENGSVEIVITTVEALMQKMLPKKVLYNKLLNFKVGNTYNLEEIKRDLIDLGYIRCDLIEARGQFSIRGGILDIAINDKTGVRIEFWGDDVDSIRHFNIASQRSTEMINEVTIYPSHEFIIEKDINKICEEIENKYDYEKYKDNIKNDIELIKNGNYISKIDKYYDTFYDNSSNLLEYIQDDYIILLDEINKIKARVKNVLEDNNNIQKMLTEKVIWSNFVKIYKMRLMKIKQ